jgi:SAM-dependent methyltransferase
VIRPVVYRPFRNNVENAVIADNAGRDRARGGAGIPRQAKADPFVVAKPGPDRLTANGHYAKPIGIMYRWRLRFADICRVGSSAPTMDGFSIKCPAGQSPLPILADPFVFIRVHSWFHSYPNACIRGLMKSSTERFSDRVEQYNRYRPRYPNALLDFLVSKTPVPATIADIGSGTGILSGQLLQFGYQVMAVEPNKPMREAAEARLSQDQAFHSVDGTAENTTLPSFSVDAVTCAQSFHWFDRAKCRTEFDRILRPKGLIALIWNDRSRQDPLMEQYDELLIRFVPEYPNCAHRRVSPAGIVEFFANGSFELFTFPNHQFLTRDEFLGRLVSSSYVPLAGEPGHKELIEACNALFDQFAVNGSIRFLYETQIYLGR